MCPYRSTIASTISVLRFRFSPACHATFPMRPLLTSPFWLPGLPWQSTSTFIPASRAHSIALSKYTSAPCLYGVSWLSNAQYPTGIRSALKP